MNQRLDLRKHRWINIVQLIVSSQTLKHVHLFPQFRDAYIRDTIQAKY